MAGWLAIAHWGFAHWPSEAVPVQTPWLRRGVMTEKWILFTTLTALLRSEFSSSACLPKELGGLPREFCRGTIGGVPGPRRSQSCWTSDLQAPVIKMRVSDRQTDNALPSRVPLPLTRLSRSAFASLPQGDSEPCACCRESPARSPWLHCWKWGPGPWRLRGRRHSGGFRQTPARELGKEG